MFPSNLHRNIVQLDRQISLLENECKNMEVDKRRKGFKPEHPHSKCSRISSLQVKASPVKVTLKNIDSSKRSKKVTPPASGRLQSAGSLQSWSDIQGNGAGGKSKFCKVNGNASVCSCQKLNGAHCNSRKKNKPLNCDFCNEDSLPDLAKGDIVEDHKQDQVLHKELLYSNSGGTIEVTVTQKSGVGKEVSPIKKKINSEDRNQKDGDSCKCQIKGQKWSEILSSDASKKKAVKENFVKNKFSPDETKTINHPFSCNNNRGYEGDRSQENINSSNNVNNLSIQEENFEVPVKLSSPAYKIKNQNQPQINGNKFEKEIQCALENSDLKEPVKESNDPLKLIQHLVNQLKQMPINDVKHSPKDVETVANETPEKEPHKDLLEEVKQNLVFGDTCQNNSSLELVKQHCENLIKDKELLSKELAAKDIIIATMNKREEEYLSLITRLKLNLEKTKESAQEGIEAVKELTVLKNTLLENMKFTEAVQKNFAKAHEFLEKYILENQRLKTQIKILTLEAQKYEVLLAGKEAEISKYREEIQKFQRQISEHLAALKSNAEGIDVEKMMQAIFQQSQIFLQTDLDSVIAESDQKEISKLQNALMHSSPTSTKTSVVNSSWKQISSIHDHDQTNTDSYLNLNDDSNAKDYFQIFGENASSVSKSSKKSKQTLIENLLEGKKLKRSLSFTSCISVHDDDNSSSGSSRIGDFLQSNEEDIHSNEGNGVAETERNNRVSFEKAQSNIDEVLKNMKLKFSKKIFETSIGNCTTDDFLDSQISSISQC